MEVTHRLGLRYIWIDSLCIIQDSPQDWQQEAPRMRDIYSGSYLNIAAARGSGKEGGLFTRRPLIALERCEVNWGGDFLNLHVGLGSRWDLEFQRSPLRSRAWAVQELLLAPRIVYFCTDQMFWECAKRNANEMFPDEVPQDKHQKKMIIYPYEEQSTESDVMASKSRAISTWTDIVTQYSRGNLTFRSKDKLVAISGLAKAIGLPHEDYLAGLWRSCLLQQLTWQVNHTQYLLTDPESFPVPRRDAMYRAPSWSWASVNGLVLFPDNVWGYAPPLRSTTLLEAHVELKHQMDPTGPVHSGVLRLECHLAAAEFSKYFVKEGWRVYTTNLTSMAPPFVSSDSHNSYMDAPAIELSLDDGPTGGVKGRLYYFLPLTEHNLFGKPYVVGIVIEPTGSVKGEYRRIGRFEVCPSPEPDSNKLFWAFFTHFDQYETNKDLWESRRFDEHGEHDVRDEHDKQDERTKRRYDRWGPNPFYERKGG